MPAPTGTAAQHPSPDKVSADKVSAESAIAERASAAKITSMRELAAERATVLGRALTRSHTAQAALDTARSDLASARADQALARERATLVHGLAVEASQRATVSARSFAVLARTLAQQQRGAATADIFLGGHSLSHVLDQLSTLDQLHRVSENIDAVQARAQGDRAHAHKLEQQDAQTRVAASTVLIEESQAAFDTAARDFEAAGVALVSAAAHSANADANLAALDVRPIIRTDVGQLSDQGWANPASGVITDTYGPRPVRPLAGVGTFHYGTDIGASCGTPVFAGTSGVVQATGAVGSYGNWILIDHGEGVQTGYAHLVTGAILVNVGDRVAAGQQIASVGSTGLSTGCHTHVEVRVDGVRIDPQPFFLSRGVVLGG